LDQILPILLIVAATLCFPSTVTETTVAFWILPLASLSRTLRAPPAAGSRVGGGAWLPL